MKRKYREIWLCICSLIITMLGTWIVAYHFYEKGSEDFDREIEDRKKEIEDLEKEIEDLEKEIEDLKKELMRTQQFARTICEEMGYCVSKKTISVGIYLFPAQTSKEKGSDRKIAA